MLQRGRGKRPAEPEQGRGAETRRLGCRLDGKLMFTAESIQRFQGEGRRARPGGPGGRTGREPGFCGAQHGAEARRVGAATKLAAREGRACPAPPGPKFPEAAAARDPPPGSTEEETRSYVFQWSPREVEGPECFGGASSQILWGILTFHPRPRGQKSVLSGCPDGVRPSAPFTCKVGCLDLASGILRKAESPGR